ncbi:unnamed protein product, partial [Cuscuta europaea]
MWRPCPSLLVGFYPPRIIKLLKPFVDPLVVIAAAHSLKLVANLRTMLPPLLRHTSIANAQSRKMWRPCFLFDMS